MKCNVIPYRCATKTIPTVYSRQGSFSIVGWYHHSNCLIYYLLIDSTQLEFQILSHNILRYCQLVSQLAVDISWEVIDELLGSSYSGTQNYVHYFLTKLETLKSQITPFVTQRWTNTLFNTGNNNALLHFRYVQILVRNNYGCKVLFTFLVAHVSYDHLSCKKLVWEGNEE